MKRPAFQFYPADWRRDAALQSCSVAARGLWIELMCVMHDCEPYGVLSVNGKSMTSAQVARLVGEQEKVVARLMTELEDAGVCSRDEQGRLFSRRMVKDEAVREVRAAGGQGGAEHGYKGAEHGKKGGRPRKHQEGSTNEEKTPLKTPLDGFGNPPPSSSSSSSSVIEEAKASLSPAELDDPEATAKDMGDEGNGLPACPHRELIDLFCQHLPMLPQPKPELWSGARASALKARWRWVLTAKKRDGKRYATTREQALDWFGRFFAYVAQSDFLTGRDGKWTGCDLGWLCSESNFAKVVQGNYDNREAA